MLATETIGAGNDPVVLLHGVFMDRSLWTDVARRLDRPVLAVDMPGHGDSPPAPDGATLADHVDAVVDTLRAAGLTRPVIAGHSWGGMVGLRLAIASPQTLSGLVLVNTPLRRTRGSGRFGFVAQRAMLALGLPPTAYGRLAASALVGEALRARSPDVVDRIADSTRRVGRRGLRETLRSVILEPDDAEALLDELRIPWTAVAGADDYVLRNGVRERLLARDALTVATGSHTSPLEDTDAVVAAIRHVLARAAEPEPTGKRGKAPD